jgi:hypothetical protein
MSGIAPLSGASWFASRRDRWRARMSALAIRLLLVLLAGALVAGDWSGVVVAQEALATEDVIVVLPDNMEPSRAIPAPTTSR